MREKKADMISYRFLSLLRSSFSPTRTSTCTNGVWRKQLTRQNDDLRETKERLRSELEGMNKQMDRKQKLLSGEFEVGRYLSVTSFIKIAFADSHFAPTVSGQRHIEVLERARAAESAVQTHLKDRKTLETNTTKSLAEMTAKLQEAQTLATKSEREAVVLRDGFSQYKEMQKREMGELRVEVARLVEGTRAEMEEAVSPQWITV
jgi:hypothetical protein